MPKTYTKADDSVHDLCVSLMKKYHQSLAEEKLRIDVVFVATDSEEGCALMHGGYPAAAVVRILDSKQRAMGRGDAEITIDEAGWLTMSNNEKLALLDHEIQHLCLRGGEKPKDEHGRPKLKMRKHDHQFGWFEVIAERWGKDSGEVQQAEALLNAGRQSYFAFMDNQPKRLTA